MNLVIGGAFQGKTAYAKQVFSVTGEWIDGETCAFEDIFSCGGIVHFHSYIKRMLSKEMDTETLADELFEKNPDICIVTNELGYGVVPFEAFDRKYRETTGRVCEKLACVSTNVHRVVCGIGMVIKNA